MTIDTTKPLKTRDGQTVTLITANARHTGYPLVGYIGDNIELEGWTVDGLYDARVEGDLDIVQDPTTLQAWFNCYPDGRMIRYESKEEADVTATRTRIACIKVQYQPGQYD